MLVDQASALSYKISRLHDSKIESSNKSYACGIQARELLQEVQLELFNATPGSSHVKRGAWNKLLRMHGLEG